MKSITGRARPLQLIHLHQYGFFPFSLDNAYFSLPSSHSAGPFILIRALKDSLKSKTWICATVAFGVSLCRLFTLNHYLSDIFIGALLGYFLTDWFIKKNQANILLAWLNRKK